MQAIPGNYVPWFVKTIAKFGGKFIPYVDINPYKDHTSGRRESRVEPRYVGLEEGYFTDHHGSLRRMEVRVS